MVFTILSFGQAPLVEVTIPAPFPVCNPGDCTTLQADYPILQQTTDYDVAPIPYSLSFPFVGGTRINATNDDVWSPIVILPFRFTFYGVTYNNLLVGSNGVVTFDLTAAGGFCPWAFNQTVPNPAFPIRNAIYCVYQDTDITAPPVTNPNNQNVNYYILDTGVNAPPNRVFVANWNQLPQLGDATGAAGLQTSQLVLHEGTNIIEMFIDNRVSLDSWNGGAGVIGIQNASGTQGTVPPGYNTGTWDANDVAFQFTPTGPANVGSQITWTTGGTPVGTSDSLTVCPTAPITYTATVTYTNVDGSTFDVSSNVAVDVAPPLPLVSPVDLTICSNTGAPYTANINQNALMLSSVPLVDQSIYIITYYENFIDADFGASNNIVDTAPFVTLFTFNTPPPKTIYIRIENLITGCYNIRLFVINVVSGPSGTFSYSGSPYCTNDANPVFPTLNALTLGGVYSSTSPGLTINSTTGAIIPFASIPGTYSVSYDVAATSICPSYSSTSTVTIEACSCTVNASSLFESVCVNNLLTPITLTSSNGATSASISSGSLPLGVNGVFESGTYRIVGIPNVAGTYTFTVTCQNGITDTCSATITIQVYDQSNAGIDGCISVSEESTNVIDLSSLLIGEQSGGSWTRISGSGGTFSAAAGTYVPSIGATTSTFSYTINVSAPCISDSSNATVIVNGPPCGSLSATIFETDEIGYYPNPFTDVVNIDFSQPIRRIKVVNVLGQQVFLNNYNEANVQANLSHLSAGSYFMIVDTAINSKTFKVIKN